MSFFFQIVYFSIYNIWLTLKSPLFWVVLGILFFQYRKIGEMEKKILGKQKMHLVYNIFISTILGLIGGAIGSIIFIYFEITINPKDFYYILPLAILLSLINPKFICFSYAGGVVSLISLIMGFDVNVTGIMFVIGVLHLIESFLILIDGSRNRIPVFMEKRREIIGGFTMNRFWPVPFSILMDSGYIYPVTIIAILGYGDYALTNYPKKKSKETAGFLFVFSIILIIFAKLSMDNNLFKYIASIFAPLAHELIIIFGRKREEKGEYIFAPSSHGLKILDTLTNGIGHRLGLKPGDIILSLNGRRIYSNRDIEEILYFNPNFIWMNIFDTKKGLILKEYRDYENGIKDLGVVVVSSIPEHVFVVRELEPPISRLIQRFKKNKSRFKN